MGDRGLLELGVQNLSASLAAVEDLMKYNEQLGERSTMTEACIHCVNRGNGTCYRQRTKDGKFYMHATEKDDSEKP